MNLPPVWIRKQSERFSKAFAKLTENCTFVIALFSIRNADRILVLDKGRIARKVLMSSCSKKRVEYIIKFTKCSWDLRRKHLLCLMTSPCSWKWRWIDMGMRGMMGSDDAQKPLSELDHRLFIRLWGYVKHYLGQTIISIICMLLTSTTGFNCPNASAICHW